jgi:hypothetical protein
MRTKDESMTAMREKRKRRERKREKKNKRMYIIYIYIYISRNRERTSRAATKALTKAAGERERQLRDRERGKRDQRSVSAYGTEYGTSPNLQSPRHYFSYPQALLVSTPHLNRTIVGIPL